MRWIKIVLLFQAVVTLMIGIVFFSQLVVIEQAEVNNIKAELTSGENFTNTLPPTIIDIKQRFTVAAYVLFVISIIELLLISRLLR